MQTDHIVALLLEERNRLDAAIQALQGGAKRRGRPPGKKTASASTDSPVAAAALAPAAKPAKRKLSAKGRKAISEAARRRWAAIKDGKAPSPFAKRKKAAKA